MCNSFVLSCMCNFIILTLLHLLFAHHFYAIFLSHRWQQLFLTTTKIYKGRARGSHIVAPHVKLALIEGVVSSITIPLVDVIGVIKPLCQKQGIGIMPKYLHSSNAKNKNMLISSTRLTHVHRCYR